MSKFPCQATADSDCRSRYTGIFPKASISSDSAEAAAIGSHVMRDLNGTAVDAAVASLFAMGLTLPQSMGLGGGCLLTIFDSDSGNVTVINGRETAPSYSTDGMFAGKASRSDVGVDAIAVPGELAAYFKAHELFGKVEFPALIQPTIDLARKGFPVGIHMANAIIDRQEKMKEFRTTEVVDLLWNNETNDYYRLGDVMRRLDFAETLEVIQREGKDSLYSANGTLAKLLIQDLSQKGSKMTVDDLVNYEAGVDVVTPRTLANGINLYSSGLPSSGPILGFIIDTVIRTFGTDSLPLQEQELDLFYRYIAEVMKFGYGQRGLLGDPEFDDVSGTLSRLQSPEFADQVSHMIRNMEKTIDDVTFYQNAGKSGTSVTKEYRCFREDKGTAGLVVVDSDGNAVSGTSTINAFFGSFVLSTKTGILLNNHMDDFCNDWTNLYGVTPSQTYNRIAPGKRPTSSMAPAILTTGGGEKDQRFEMAISAAGGTHITTAQSLVALRTLLFDNVSLEDAVAEPRIHHQLQPNELMYEDYFTSFPGERRRELAACGHVVRPMDGRGSEVMAIRRLATGELETVTEWRKRGSVAGY